MADPKRASKKASVVQSFGLFFLAVGLLLAIRWLFVEPFIVPSGSMIPELLVHDHIFVAKYSYGLRWPFTKDWIVFWGRPGRGDVVVFHSPQNSDVYFIKRIIGLPGDQIAINPVRTSHGNCLGRPPFPTMTCMWNPSSRSDIGSYGSRRNALNGARSKSLMTIILS